MLHELERMVLVLVGDGLEEEAVQALLEREVDHGLDWVQAALARDLGHRPMRPLHRVEDEDPLVRGRPRLRPDRAPLPTLARGLDRKSTRLNSSHGYISYAVFCLKKKSHCPAAHSLQRCPPQRVRPLAVYTVGSA